MHLFQGFCLKMKAAGADYVFTTFLTAFIPCNYLINLIVLSILSPRILHR
jgi:hypothetical protein